MTTKDELTTSEAALVTEQPLNRIQKFIDAGPIPRRTSSSVEKHDHRFAAGGANPTTRTQPDPLGQVVPPFESSTIGMSTSCLLVGSMTVAWPLAPT